MKKIVLVSVLMFMVFAAYSATLDTKTLSFTGYYEAPARSVILSIWDYNNKRLYSSDTTVTDNHLGNSAEEIFHWTLDGTISAGATLTFSFSTFQAQLNGVYYRPAYTISFNVDSGDPLAFSSGSGLTNSTISTTKSSGASSFNNSQYPYSFVFRSATGGSLSSGDFLMKITDYYGKTSGENIEGDFSYRCDVLVLYEEGS